MLPPGVSETNFAEALRQFEQVVGKENVFSKPEDVALYEDAYSPVYGKETERVASAAVAPKSTEEVQAIVKIANKFLIPLYAISTGRNLGYGGAAPVQSGSVVVDLKRMNKIVEVSESGAYAIVEPGVSYFDLYRYIQDRKLKLWIDPPDPGWGSVIGNPMDHGFGYSPWPYRDHWDSHCGMEVVLPNGDVVRTGMSGVRNEALSKIGAQVKFGPGPSVDGLFLQSTLGIVTRMGIWLMPEPESYLQTTVEAFNHEDLHKLCEMYNYLTRTGVLNGFCLTVNPLVEDITAFIPGLIRSKDSELNAILDNPKGLDTKALGAIAKREGKGIWGLRLGFYGNRNINRAHWEYTKEKFSVIPGVVFKELQEWNYPIPADQVPVTHSPTHGIPSLSVFFLGTRTMTPTPQRGHLWIQSMVPFTGEDIFKAQKVYTEASHELGYHFNPIHLPYPEWVHSAAKYVIAYGVDSDPAKAAQNLENARKLYRLNADNGWGEYRAHPLLQADIMDQYDYNDHALRRFHETLKDSLDPNGIMGNGKYGIWPKRFRKERI